MLPPATERVWDFLKSRPELGGFVLVGGSALSLRIGHRISEDLDLAYLYHQLPRHRLEALVSKAQAAGLEFANNDDEAAVAEFVQLQRRGIIGVGTRGLLRVAERGL